MGIFDSFKDTMQLLKNTFVVIGRNPAIFRPTVAQIIIFGIFYAIFIASIIAVYLATGVMTLIAFFGILIALFIIIPLFPYIKVYYNAAQCWIVYHTFTGHNISYDDGLKRAKENKMDIFVIGTIDIVLTWIANKLKERSNKGGIWVVVGLLLKLLAKGIEEGWDLIGHYLLPAAIIQDKSVREVLPDIKNIKNNVPGALVGVFGIDFAGNMLMSLVGYIYVILLIGTGAIGYFLGTWIPFYIMIVLIIGLNVVSRILVDMVKTVYFTIFYTALTIPMNIPEQYRAEVTNYLLYKPVSKMAAMPAAQMPGTAYQPQQSNPIAQDPQSSPAADMIPQGQGNAPAQGSNPSNQASPGPQAAQEQAGYSQSVDPAAVKLLAYIKHYRQQGHTDDLILRFLVQHNWPEDIVRKALEYRPG